jgi:ATP-binding cassette, subfamily C, bacterial CydC
MDWRALFRTLNVPFTPLILAIVLTVLMTLSALGLLALSGWFLTAASIAGLAAAAGAYSFNILQPSSMIRALAVSRTLTRYVERLLSHDATLRLVVKLRRYIFDGLLDGIGKRTETDQEAIDRLISDASAVEGALLRTLLPLIGALIAASFTPLLALVIAPSAFWPGLIPLAVFIVTFRVRAPGYRLLAEAIDRESKRARHRAIALADGRHELQLAFTESELETLTLGAYQPLAELRRQKTRRELTDKWIIGIGHAAAFAWLALLPLELPILVALLLGLLATSELLIPGISVSFEQRRVEIALQRLPEPTRSSDRTPHSAILTLRDVTFAPSDDSDALTEPMTLELRPSQVLQLTGPSGAGKTTCLRMIAGLNPHRSGTISRPGSIALVEQAPWLPSDQLWKSLILGLPQAPTEEAFWAALETVELADWVKQLPEAEKTWIGTDGILPSGGQWRRLAIARMLMQDAELVLLDEPTEGLEPALAERIVSRLSHRLARRMVILVSHRPEVSAMVTQHLELSPKRA